MVFAFIMSPTRHDICKSNALCDEIYFTYLWLAVCASLKDQKLPFPFVTSANKPTQTKEYNTFTLRQHSGPVNKVSLTKVHEGTGYISFIFTLFISKT